MLTFFTQYITFQNQSLSFVWKNQVLFVVKTTLDNWTTSENRVNLNYFVQSWYCSVIFLNLKPRNWSQFHCCQTNQFVSLISVPEGSKCCNAMERELLRVSLIFRLAPIVCFPWFNDGYWDIGGQVIQCYSIREWIGSLEYLLCEYLGIFVDHTLIIILFHETPQTYSIHLGSGLNTRDVQI